MRRGVAAFRLKCCYRAALGPCGIHKRNEVAIALLLAVFLRRRQCYLNRGRLSWVLDHVEAVAK
jgi:hypothetical protein